MSWTIWFLFAFGFLTLAYLVGGDEGEDAVDPLPASPDGPGPTETLVRLATFDPASETLEIENSDGEYGDGDYRLDERDEGTYVVMAGHDVVLFEGMRRADLANLMVEVTNAP